MSVLPGEAVGLYVNNPTGEEVRVAAYRMGFYGGLGARAVWRGWLSADEQPELSPLTGPIDGTGGLTGDRTRTAVAPWKMTHLVSTKGWPEGHYLFRLNAGGQSRYVPLTVRSRSLRDRLVVMTAVMTTAAYNQYGGGSLYFGETGGLPERSLAVSLDRPNTRDFGAGFFLTDDRPVVQTAEALRLPLAYVTDYDLAVDPTILRGATGLVMGGHAEYLTARLFDAITKRTAEGMNLAIFGANTAYWRVRLAGETSTVVPSGRRQGPRVVVGTKDATLDPLARKDPSGATARFRDSPWPRREESLTGTRYDCIPGQGDWVVSDPTWFGYRGTGARVGDRFEGVLGPETDRVFPGIRRVPTQVVAYGPVQCGSVSTIHTAVYWRSVGGAGVFNAASMGFPCSLIACTDIADRFPCGAPGCKSDPARLIAAQFFRKVASNVLRTFSRPRAGLRHPVDSNLSDFVLPQAVASQGNAGRGRYPSAWEMPSPSTPNPRWP